MDLRERVAQAYDQKQGSQEEVAERFGVSVSWVEKLLRRRREANSIAPRQGGGDYRSVFVAKDLEKLRQIVDKHPDATLAELQQLCGIACSYVAVWRALKKLGYTRKKRLYVPASKTVQT